MPERRARYQVWNARYPLQGSACSGDGGRANVHELRDIRNLLKHLPSTRVSRAVSAYYLGFGSADLFVRAESTSRTPETRRSLSIKESNSSCRLPLPKTISAASAPHRQLNPPEEFDLCVCVSQKIFAKPLTPNAT